VYVDICGGSPEWGHQMTVGLPMTANFDDLRGYFFGNFRDKASTNIWQYATLAGLLASTSGLRAFDFQK